MSISEQFIKFIFSSDPAIELDHAVKKDPYSGCAIGKFAAAHYPEIRIASVADMIAADVEFAVEREDLINDLAFFNMDVDNSNLMTLMTPTMGHMAQFIRNEYPRLVQLA